MRSNALQVFLEGDEDTTVYVWKPADGRDVKATIHCGRIDVFGTPRELRAWAEKIVAAADETCRLEDRMSDEPLPLDVA